MENEDVEVINNSPLQMIGKGRQGAVFQFTDEACVKVFGNEEDCEREFQALSMGENTGLFPKVYDHGPTFIVMEIIKGIDLREYLQSQPLTEELSAKLIEMLVVFKDIGFERIDHHKRQIYLQPDGRLRVIDVARAIWRDRVYPYPRKLLTSLGEENKAVFLSHVEALAPELFEEWKYYMEMDQLAREIFPLLVEGQSSSKVVKELSNRLLTTKDEENHILQLEGLMHKVFKEEWVKTMLAKGHNPDEVMEKIDQYWDSKQQQMVEKPTIKPEKIDLREINRLLGDSSKKGKKQKSKLSKKDRKTLEKGTPAEKSKILRKELSSILIEKIKENSKYPF